MKDVKYLVCLTAITVNHKPVQEQDLMLNAKAKSDSEVFVRKTTDEELADKLMIDDKVEAAFLFDAFSKGFLIATSDKVTLGPHSTMLALQLSAERKAVTARLTLLEMVLEDGSVQVSPVREQELSFSFSSKQIKHAASVS